MSAPAVVCGSVYSFRWRVARCWGKCGITDSIIVSSEGNPYYGAINTCTNCGDQWSEGCMGERPFGDRYWRHKAIARALETFERACQCRVRRDVHFSYAIPCEHDSVARP